MGASCVMAQCCLNITIFNSPAGGDSYLLPANVIHHQHCASFDVLAAVWLRVLFVWSVMLSLNSQFWVFLRNMMPSECQELWYIAEEQNWVPSDSRGISQKNGTGYPVTHGISQKNITGYPLTHGISQENRTGYPVTHVVYPRRT